MKEYKTLNEIMADNDLNSYIKLACCRAHNITHRKYTVENPIDTNYEQARIESMKAANNVIYKHKRL